jgi:hypothetical protein
MTKWKKYRDFGRIAQLKNEGRELVGETIYWTEKRDGSNISFRIDDEGFVKFSSHNLEVILDEDLNRRIVTAESYATIMTELMQEKEFQNCILYFELISAGHGATRTEPKHKIPRLILFDIFNVTTQQFLSYNYIFQVAHKFKIPIVKLVHTSIPPDLDQLYNTRDFCLDWCKRHRREGVVGKCWKSTDKGYESFYFKEKIDLPKRPKLLRPASDEIKLPRMPDEKIFNAIGQAEEECERAGNSFRNPKFGMPLVATHLNVQAKEHDYAVPSGFFQLYQAYLERKTKEAK